MSVQACGRRTLPRVRELKQHSRKSFLRVGSRTLPRVRELKPVGRKIDLDQWDVAPFPGCVN